MRPNYSIIPGIMDVPEALALAPKSFGLTQYSTSGEMNRSAAYWLARAIHQAIDARGHCVLMPSAGRTPTELYSILRKGYADLVDWSRVILVQMDEYADLGSNHEQSFAAYIRSHLAEPLGIGEFICFNDSQGKLQRSFTEYDAKISSFGGIDVTLFGVGENGHLGFNEPGSTPASKTRMLPLDDRTLQSNAAGVTDDDFLIPTQGVTVGLSVLLSSKRSLLLASGTRKKDAIVNLVSGPISPEWPVTYLRNQLGSHVMFTEDCAPQRAIWEGNIRASA